MQPGDGGGWGGKCSVGGGVWQCVQIDVSEREGESTHPSPVPPRRDILPLPVGGDVMTEVLQEKVTRNCVVKMIEYA